MDDCQTPTLLSPFEFTFNHTPSMVTDIRRVQEVRKLMVNRNNVRCYTPILKDIHSPNISPIYRMAVKHSPVTPYMVGEFKMPDNIKISYRSTPSPNSQKTPQQQQNSISDSGGDKSPYMLNLSNISESHLIGGLEIGKPSPNASKNSFILNQTLNVPLLLKNYGMEEYSETFEKEGIDLEKFLTMRKKDLKKLGINSDEHCKVIMNLVNDLNSTEM